MHTYRLAICEDDHVILEEICRICDEILKDMGTPHQITPFSSAVDIADILEKGEASYDLLILDIQMEQLTGMELARKLRERKNRVSIIFISGHEEYLREGYSVQPVDFLLKPPDRKKLEKALHTDLELNHRSDTVLLQKGSRGLQLVLSEILYVETCPNHSVRICQTDKEDVFPVSLANMAQLLPAQSFARCHNSYMVNLEHVRKIDRMRLRLDDGSVIPIGRKYYKDCQNTIITYMNQYRG